MTLSNAHTHPRTQDDPQQCTHNPRTQDDPQQRTHTFSNSR